MCERSIDLLLSDSPRPGPAPGPGMNPWPRHVPPPGTEPTTPQLQDRAPTTEPHRPGLLHIFNTKGLLYADDSGFFFFF